MQAGLAEVVHVAVRMAHFPGHEDVVLAGEEEVLAGGVEVVLVLEGEVVDGRFLFVILLFVEGPGGGGAVFPSAVVEAEGAVATEEEVRVEVSRSHGASADAETLDVVGAEDGVHGAEVELVLLVHVVDGDVTGDEDLGRLEEHLEGRHLLELIEQTLDAAFALSERGVATVGPEGIGLREVAREGRLDAPGEGEDGVGTGDVRPIVRVAAQLVGVHLLTAVEELEEHVGVVRVQLPEAVRAAAELLFDAQLTNEVEVDVSGHIEEYLLDRVGAVGRDIESASEAVALRVDGHEGQVGAGLAAHVDGVHDIIMVEGVGQGGREGTDEAIEQKGDVVVEDVDALEDLVEVSSEGAVFVEALVDALLTGGADDNLFGSGLAAVVDVGDLLA